MSRCEVGCKSDDPCRNEAAFYAINWGWGPGSDEVHVCERHAREAASGGTTVRDADGDDVQINDDGELAKVVLIEVAS